MVRMAVNWAEVEYVFVENPACKKCGSERYKRIRTETSDEGGVMRKGICLDCGAPNKFLWAVPHGGKDDLLAADNDEQQDRYYWEADVT